MPNISPNQPKTETLHQKSIFSYNVYRTSNQRAFLPPGNFKSVSGTSAGCNDPEVIYFNDKIFTRNQTCKRVKECCTQTSKTILDLVKKESRVDAQTQDAISATVDAQNQTSEMIRPVELPQESLRTLAKEARIRSQTQSQTRSQSQTQTQTQSKTSSLDHSKSKLLLEIDLEDLQQQEEEPPMSPDSLGASPRRNFSLENCPYSVASRLSGFTLEGSCHEQDCIFNNEKTLTNTFLTKNRRKLSDHNSFTSKSFIDYTLPNYIPDAADVARVPTCKPKTTRKNSKSLDCREGSFNRKKNSFMFPTRASQIKSIGADVRSTNSLIPPMRRGKSTSPRVSGDKRRFESSKKIPYIDQSKSDVSSSTTLVNATRNPEVFRLKQVEDDGSSDASVRFSEDVLSLLTNLDNSNSSFNDGTICIALNKLQQPDWRVALRGLADVVEICRCVDIEIIYDYMCTINHRLIELLKSPRSHVCRTACQAAGHLFEYVKDTRRPIFDEIVDILLHKTADANKFIRHDANMALDCMVTHINTFNAVRSLCSKGPFHKNPLVRCATARLLVCAIVIVGADNILNPNNNECTRKRIIQTMVRLMDDKSLETRKLAERIYKVLSRDGRFNVYLKKYLDREKIAKIQKTLRFIHKK